MSGKKCAPGHYDGDGCTFPTEGHLLHTCDAPATYGGMEMTKRRSKSQLGHMGHCNRTVTNYGDRCWQHPLPQDVRP